MVARVIASRYALEAEIGHGGMGAVWRATDQVLGRTVALKKIGVAPGGFTPNVLRAEREAQLAARLSHANVVSVFDLVHEEAPAGSGSGSASGVATDEQWLVMEYVDGTDLSAMIKAQGPLAHDEVARVLAQTANALVAAHGAGIVHRDVKPSNILLTPAGQVKLSDFGIARTQTDPALTQTGLVTGSPAYLSPEVASGQSATPASDAWSWGATMFHALEGHPPYEMGENLLGALYRIVHEEPPRARTAGWLAPVLEGTMTRDPAQRWAIADARAYLEDGANRSRPVAVRSRTRSYDEAPGDGSAEAGTTLLPSLTSVPPPPPAAAAPPASERSERRRPWALIVLLALALVVAMAVAFWIGFGDGDDAPSSLPNTTSSRSSSPSPTPSDTPSPSETPSGPQPDEADMKTFAASYVSAAVLDPRRAFDLLTPEYQAASGGYTGYRNFWGTVTRARVITSSADPAALTVSYRYRYVQRGSGPHVEDVTLRLTFDNGQYLIAGTG